MYKPLTSFYANAHIEWICANGLTPYILIDCNILDVIVPEQFINNGFITLNLSPSAVIDFNLNETFISFSSSFHGRHHNIYCPISSIISIFAKEDPANSTMPVNTTINKKAKTVTITNSSMPTVVIEGKLTTNPLTSIVSNNIKPTKSRAHLTLVKKGGPNA
jgi:stringent starvation protein B